MQPHALVLYKGQPALVEQSTAKHLLLRLPDGTTRKVRPKDVLLLHPGACTEIPRAAPPAEADLQEAWALLEGETTTLADLATLLFGDYTPQSAWQTWQAVADGLYFTGTPEQVQARTTAQVEAERRARLQKAQKAQAWEAFLARARQNHPDPKADADFLREIEALALGKTTHSRALKALGHQETPENAHRLLLRWGIWTPAVNPYPHRLELPLKAPTVPLPPPATFPRRDLTHLPAYAIDDAGSQDPDDALSVEGQRVWVHIADVAARVPPNSPADVEARGRGATLYLPEAIVPMLPEEARATLALGLQTPSPALSIGIDLTPEGEIEAVEVTPSWVRVERLNYAEAEQRLEEPTLAALKALMDRRGSLRARRGAVALWLPEVKVVVEGGEIRLKPIQPLRSRQMVREAMLLAGEALARYAQAHHLPIPYTVQEPPSQPSSPLPSGLAGAYALRRTLRPSRYTLHPEAHHGLGLPFYAQATSPLRRYLDLVVHQQIWAHLRGETPLTEQDILERIGEVEAVVRRVRQAERLSRRHWLLAYLLAHPYWQGEAVVVDTQPPWSTVILPELGLTERVHTGTPPALNTTLHVKPTTIDLPELQLHLAQV